jgi:hypothetical protein
MDEKKWITKDGTKIPYNKLEDSHILNILKYIEKHAREGILIHFSDSSLSGDIWYDEEIIKGEEVKNRLDYYGIKKEAKKRGLK